MFQVETNAKRIAEMREANLIARGVPATQARAMAKMEMNKTIREGNAWIKANVGLN